MCALILLECCTSCPVAKEGESITFRGSFTHTTSSAPEIIWLKKETRDVYSRCRPNKPCKDETDRTTTSLEARQQNTYEFVFTIKSFSVSDVGNWSLYYSGVDLNKSKNPLYACYLSLNEKENEIKSNKITSLPPDKSTDSYQPEVKLEEIVKPYVNLGLIVAIVFVIIVFVIIVIVILN